MTNKKNETSDITILIFPEEESVYVELDSFIAFLRDPKNEKKEDEVYTAGLRSIANFLEEKKADFLSQRDEFQSVFSDNEEEPGEAPKKDLTNKRFN